LIETSDTPRHCTILGTRVDATSYDDAARMITTWAGTGKAHYVCAANVHMVMEAWDDPRYQQVVNGADLVTPDGMPLVWGLRLSGISEAVRVCGPTLTLRVCQAAADSDIPIALYGGTERSLAAFTAFLHDNFPRLRVVCEIPPPFRPLTAEEDNAYTRQIVASAARIVFVGIGCPKQERWIAEHRGRIPAVMLGVGAAFDFHSGRVKQAPPVLQQLGLEWLFRLYTEPRRLWKRYLKHNPRFILFFALQVVRDRLLLPFKH
jgi:N-acetylglucosaminyldiphosphoundecaprenol N-acetyl-beta-D-mannosaminyltransferase